MLFSTQNGHVPFVYICSFIAQAISANVSFILEILFIYSLFVYHLIVQILFVLFFREWRSWVNDEHLIVGQTVKVIDDAVNFLFLE